MDPRDALDLLERQYKSNLFSREEYIARKAVIKFQMKLSQDLARQGSRGRELYQLKDSRQWPKSQFRVRPLAGVDPDKSAAAAQRFREMWMRRQNLNPLLTKATIAGGIPGLLAGYAGSQAYEKYPEEEDILAELEAIAGQKDDSRRKAIERAWIRNMFGRLANE